MLPCPSSVRRPPPPDLPAAIASWLAALHLLWPRLATPAFAHDGAPSRRILGRKRSACGCA